MKKKLIMLVLVLAIVCVVAVACEAPAASIAPNTNILSNGNLERGATDWTLNSTATAKPLFSAIDKDEADYDDRFGASYVTLKSESKGVYTQYAQTVALDRGATYCLSADVYVTTTITAGGNRGAYIGLKGYTYVASNVTSTEKEWTTVKVYFVNDTEEEVTVVFGLGTDSSLVTEGTVRFDNISLVKMSEEDAKALLAINLRDGNKVDFDANYNKTTEDTIFTVLVSVLGAGLFVAAYFVLRALRSKKEGKPLSENKKNWLATLYMVIVLVVAFAVRLALSMTTFGYGSNLNALMNYASNMAEKGLWTSYYEASTYYAPGVTYLLYIIGVLAVPLKLVAGTQGMAIFVKIPAILADLALLVIVFMGVMKRKDALSALVAGLLLAVCPVLFIASSLWGVYVSVGVLFLVLTFMALRERKLIRMTVFYFLAVMFSEEALLLLPLLLVFAILTYVKRPETRVVLPVAATLAFVVGYAVTVPLAINFYVAGHPFIVLERYCTHFAMNNHFALNSFNLFAMCGVGADTINTAGTVMSAILAAAVIVAGILIYLKNRSRKDILLIGGWTMMGLYVLCARMDWYVVLFGLVLLFVYATKTMEKRVLLTVGGLGAVATVNACYALYVGGNVKGGVGAGAVSIASHDPVAIVFSVVAVVLMGLLTYLMVDICLRGRSMPVQAFRGTNKEVKEEK